jgi:hypothetical protein
MRILRTDGAGENYADERLRTLRKMLTYHELKHIYMLHDHKGTLTVVWEKEPTKEEKETVSDGWSFFCEYEVEHKLITFKQL